MASSPFPYFDAREKILEREARAAEAAKQRNFLASENAKQRSQQHEEFLQTLGIQQQNVDINKQRAAALEDYYTKLGQAAEQQAQIGRAKIAEEVTNGNFATVEPHTPGAVQVGENWYKPVSPKAKLQVLHEAQQAEWQGDVAGGVKAGIIPKDKAPALLALGPTLGKTYFASTIAASLGPRNIEQQIVSITKRMATNEISHDQGMKQINLLTNAVRQMNPVAMDAAAYQASRANFYNLQNAQKAAFIKLAPVAFQGINIPPNDPKFIPTVVARINAMVGKKVGNKALTPREAALAISYIEDKAQRAQAFNMMQWIMGRTNGTGGGLP